MVITALLHSIVRGTLPQRRFVRQERPQREQPGSLRGRAPASQALSYTDAAAVSAGKGGAKCWATPQPPPWVSNPHALVSLWDMLGLYGFLFGVMSSTFELIDDNLSSDPSEEHVAGLRSSVLIDDNTEALFKGLGLRSTLRQLHTIREYLVAISTYITISHANASRRT